MSNSKHAKSSFDNILACIDGSKYSDKVLSRATEFAAEYDSNLYLLYIMDKSLANFWTETDFMIEPSAPQIHLVDSSKSKKLIDSMMEKYQHKAKESIQKLQTKSGIPSHSDIDKTKISYEILVGDAASDILEYAKRKKIDLIVMGSRGLGTFKKLMLGSVSSKVSQYAKCPVLIVK